MPQAVLIGVVMVWRKISLSNSLAPKLSWWCFWCVPVTIFYLLLNGYRGFGTRLINFDLVLISKFGSKRDTEKI